MSIFKLIGTKFRKEMVDLEHSLISSLASVDFETVELNQLEEYESILTKLSVQLAKAQTVKEKELNDVKVITDRRAKLLEDATRIDAKLNDGSLTDEQKPKFEMHLKNILDEVENIDSEIDSEKTEADDAVNHFNMLKEAVESSAAKLANAKKLLGSKKKELDKLKLQEDKLKEQADQQKIILGIKSKTDSFGTVVGVLDGEIAKRKEKMAAEKIKMDALNTHIPTSVDKPVDADIASFLGGEPVAKKSLSERLASLK